MVQPWERGRRIRRREPQLPLEQEWAAAGIVKVFFIVVDVVDVVVVLLLLRDREEEDDTRQGRVKKKSGQEKFRQELTLQNVVRFLCLFLVCHDRSNQFFFLLSLDWTSMMGREPPKPDAFLSSYRRKICEYKDKVQPKNIYGQTWKECNN